MLTKDEIIERNITLSFEFSLYVMEHPSFARQIPKGAQVVLLPKDDPELCEINRQAAEKARMIDDEPNRPTVYVEIERLRPIRSRLVGPRLVRPPHPEIQPAWQPT
ncbi:MAG: hypothetical protein FJ014_17170 [Chloroflexi bacterium]|nr:hypothetical protein [Chloroflexota bacterium]